MARFVAHHAGGEACRAALRDAVSVIAFFKFVLGQAITTNRSGNHFETTLLGTREASGLPIRALSIVRVFGVTDFIVPMVDQSIPTIGCSPGAKCAVGEAHFTTGLTIVTIKFQLVVVITGFKTFLDRAIATGMDGTIFNFTIRRTNLAGGCAIGALL